MVGKESSSLAHNAKWLLVAPFDAHGPIINTRHPCPFAYLHMAHFQICTASSAHIVQTHSVRMRSRISSSESICSHPTSSGFVRAHNINRNFPRAWRISCLSLLAHTCVPSLSLFSSSEAVKPISVNSWAKQPGNVWHWWGVRVPQF